MSKTSPHWEVGWKNLVLPSMPLFGCMYVYAIRSYNGEILRIRLKKAMVVMEISRKLACIRTMDAQFLLFFTTATSSCLFSSMDNESRLQGRRGRGRGKSKSAFETAEQNGFFSLSLSLSLSLSCSPSHLCSPLNALHSLLVYG